MNKRNGEGYPDPTAAQAIHEADRPPELRGLPEAEEHPKGIRPMKAEKLCLCCRKRWPLDCGRERCDCKEQGYLYIAGAYRHPVPERRDNDAN